MSVTSTMPAPVIQMGLVEKIVEVEQNQSHVQQLVAQEAALQTLKEQGQRIERTDKSEQGKKIREREQEGGRGKSQADKRQAGTNEHEGAQDEAEAAPAGNPWAGNIVNLKI